MELYQKLWGTMPQWQGPQRRRWTAELSYLLNIMEPKERANYYRFVSQVVKQKG